MQPGDGVTGIITENTNLTQQVEVFDNYIYDQVQTKNAEPVRGSLYVQKLEKVDSVPSNYMGVIFVNATSQAAAPSWGAKVHEAFLADYFSKTINPNPPASKDLKLRFVNQPFPLTE